MIKTLNYSHIQIASFSQLEERQIVISMDSAILLGLLILLLSSGWVITMVLNKRKKSMIQKLNEKDKALEYCVRHDTNTGLSTRRHMMDQLQNQLLLDDHSFTALYTIGVVNIGIINDAYGHDMGDAIIQYLSGVLTDEFEDTNAILGIYHAEFLVADSGCEGIDQVREKTEHLIRRLTKSKTMEHMDIAIKVNIGIAFAPEHSLEAKLLFKKASIALIQANKRGPNRYHIFQSSLYKNALKRLTLEKQLRCAVVKDEFEIFYQPRIAMDTMKVIGAEALIRWHHPDGTIVYPSRFIALAEAVGFISEITRWVIIHVARQVKSWERMGHELKVSFNISGKEFDDDFITLISEVIRDEKVNPNLLEVEITETATLKDMAHSKILVDTLMKIGIGVALDDFGTGYSSMSYIKTLRAGKLKIDRSFIQDIGEYQQRVVVESMIELGRKLDYKINVEGVETLSQLNILKTMHIDEAQGWYFLKAVPADHFLNYAIEKDKAPLSK